MQSTPPVCWYIYFLLVTLSGGVQDIFSIVVILWGGVGFLEELILNLINY